MSGRENNSGALARVDAVGGQRGDAGQAGRHWKVIAEIGADRALGKAVKLFGQDKHGATSTLSPRYAYMYTGRVYDDVNLRGTTR